MKDKISNPISRIFIGSDDFAVIDEIKPMVNKYNYRTFVFSTFTFMVALFSLLISSIVFETMRWMLWGYVIFFLVIFLLFIVSRIKRIKNNNKIILFFLYLELIISLSFGIVVGNLGQKDIVAVTYHVLLIAMPLFICDVPLRLNIIYILFLIPFYYTSYKFKLERTFFYDFINGIIYTILGIFINTVIQISHFESFRNRFIIKKERDTDTLTGTLTKHAFELKAQSEMRKESSVGIFMIFDIDNFKTINDTLGHAVGDYFISNTGRIILNNSRQSDIVGRFGGDEFVIYMPGVESIDYVNKKVQEFMDSLKKYFSKTMNYDNFSISIGCTIYKDHSKTYKEIFNEMDSALYRAKNCGKDKCCIYK